MIIRNFTPSDQECVLDMVAEFYTSPAVDHPIPVSNFADAYDEMCDGGSHRLRGLLFLEDNMPAGFCSLSFSYSTEAGGAVVLLEELYISPDFRSKGFGKKVVQFLLDEYKDKAARIRLEVASSNQSAIGLYHRFGFEVLPYQQMILENF